MHMRISRMRMKGGGRGRRCRREAGGAFSVGLRTRGPKILSRRERYCTVIMQPHHRSSALRMADAEMKGLC